MTAPVGAAVEAAGAEGPSLASLLRGTRYLAYAYAYPHKTAYRRLTPPLPLAGLWGAERRTALCLYIHVPFCEMRCGFCNLFTTVDPQRELEEVYLEALERQTRQVAGALAVGGQGPVAFARLAVGGGTPTALGVAQLQRLFDLAERGLGVRPAEIPVSVETSPATATPERLAALRERGTDRISLGVQSFVEAEAAGAGRAQRTATVARALDAIRAAGFPTLNVDLIYGLPGQTVASWRGSLEMALRWRPEELYLYPLYVRPLTGLGRQVHPSPGHSLVSTPLEVGRSAPSTSAGAPGSLDPGGGPEGTGRGGSEGEGGDTRPALYEAAREVLSRAGYRQVSMRLFRAPHAPASGGPDYDCQTDGTVGLGCGARSYTRAVHYSSEYAVGARGVRAILADYVARAEARFALAEHGFALDEGEQGRRFVLQSLLQAPGLSRPAYRARFGRDALDDLPQLAELQGHGLATLDGAALRLTDAGLARSDVIGPWLASGAVNRLAAAAELT